MIGALLVFLYADDRLDVLDITGTFWQRFFAGRAQLPPGLLMWGGFTVLVALASREIIAIFHAKGIMADRGLVMVGAVVGLTAMYLAPLASDGPAAVTLLATVLGLLFMGSLLKHSWGGRCEGAIAAGGATMFCVVYLGLLPGFFLAIRGWHGPWVVVGVIAVTKVCDVGAYFTGRAIGRHRLIPWLSPGKTWEGLIGGILLSTALCVALVAVGQARGGIGVWGYDDGGGRVFEHYTFAWWYVALAGALLGLVGQLGDLTVSLFKRDAGMKDSGVSIPGFGGLLDVFDSLVLAAPLAYWLLALGARVAS